MRKPTLPQIVFSGLLLLALAILLTFASFEATSRPQFCGTCHVMRPYYLSWKGSSHNRVACVECHIPPGIKSELKKKYQALSMVVSYFTGTYGTNPWTEVEDAACLRCHERRLIEGKELFKDILFNHTPHLTEMRRGKKLRCASCHSQIVQGTHIAVTTSTCILCHFKGETIGAGTARCELCHQVPEKVITRDNITFNHGDVKRFDMKCEWCHSTSISGNGDVPRTRCLTCHNNVTWLSRYNETEALHRIHVTDHEVQCLRCHDEIQHGIQKQIHAAESSCNACHSGGHSPQRSLYAGIGGKGVRPIPSPMYAAGTQCEGCHFLETTDKAGGIKRASEVSCMACHGAYFKMIYDRWQTIAADRTAKTRLLIGQAQAQLKPPYPPEFQDALDNLNLVERAHPIHNIDYSLALLTKSVELANAALQKEGKRTMPVQWTTLPYNTGCSSCHQGIETQVGTFTGVPYSHAIHVMQNRIQCEKCHIQHAIPLAKDVPVIKQDACASCHHTVAQAAACEKCHSQQISRGVTVQGKVLDRQGLVFDHKTHIENTGLKCVDCHLDQGKFRRTPLESRCKDCHGG